MLRGSSRRQGIASGSGKSRVQVLHRVMYPKTHSNGCQKQNKKTKKTLRYCHLHPIPPELLTCARTPCRTFRVHLYLLYTGIRQTRSPLLWQSCPVTGDLFRGKAPIRCVQFDANSRIVVPHSLLRRVTHFTTTEPFLLPELLNVLRQIPALTYLDLHLYGTTQTGTSRRFKCHNLCI